MASSSRMTLVNPIALWARAIAALSAIFCALVAVVFWSQVRENTVLLRHQATILMKSGQEQLVTGRFRDFIEMIGLDFDQMTIEVQSQEGMFKSDRSRRWFEKCLGQDLTHSRGRVHVRFCRSPDFTGWFYGLLIGSYVFFVFFTYWIARGIERRAVDALNGYMHQLNMGIKPESNLSELVETLSTLQTKVQKLRILEIESAETKAQTRLAMQVVHDLGAPLGTLKSYLSMPSTTEAKQLLQSSIARIEGISSELRSFRPKPGRTFEKIPTALYDEYVSEKRIE